MTIYVVLRESDMTEGRGPMVPDSYWVSRAKAKAYMNTKRGIMGRRPVNDNWEDSFSGGDWKIEKIKVEE